MTGKTPFRSCNGAAPPLKPFDFALGSTRRGWRSRGHS